MRDSLGKLARLPDETQVYCAHEYTLANLRFALAAEAGNRAIVQRIETESAKRAQGIPTVPSTIALEKATNPFLRHGQPAIAAGLVAQGRLTPGCGPIAVFAALREWKNSF